MYISNKPQKADRAGFAGSGRGHIMKERIKNRVHELYWNDNINCARTAIICLSELFETVVEQQTICSAVGLHGAGGYRAQCGLVEGTLMFIGVYLHKMGKREDEIVSACYNFAFAFEKAFGSLRCFELRPTGFSENDPPHMCENLTCMDSKWKKKKAGNYLVVSDIF